MGTIQYKRNFPGYHRMRDLNEDVGNSWLFCYEDRSLSGKFNSDFTLVPANGYSEYDKDALKQIMLRHEETFRKQVSELHRLYRIQRNLMDEVKRKGDNNFLLQLNSSGLSQFSNKMPFKEKEKSQNGQAFPSSNTSHSRTTLSGSSGAQTLSKSFNESSSHMGFILSEDGSSQNAKKLTNSNIEKYHRGMLDLELPADIFTDDEDVQHTDNRTTSKTLFGNAEPSCVLLPEYDVKEGHSNCQDNGSRSEAQKIASDIKNCQEHLYLIDLNEPLMEENLEDLVVSSSNFATRSSHNEAQEDKISLKPGSELLGVHKNIQEICKGEQDSGYLNPGRGEERIEHPFHKNDIGQSSGNVNFFTSNFNNARAGQSSDHMEMKINEVQDLHSLLSSEQSLFREKSSQIIKPSDSSSIVNKDLRSGLTKMPGPCSFLPQTENDKSASSQFSNSIIGQTTGAVQALSCFSGSTVDNRSGSSGALFQNFGNICDTRPHNLSSRSIARKGGEASFHQNGFCCSFQSESDASHMQLPYISFDTQKFRNAGDSEKLYAASFNKRLKKSGTDLKTANDMDLHLEAPSGFQTEHSSEHKRLTDFQEKRESISGGISWLKVKSPCSEQLNIISIDCQGKMGAERGHSPLVSPTTLEFNEEKKRELIPSLDVLPLLSNAKGKGNQPNEASVPSNGKRVSGFAVAPHIQYSSSGIVKNIDQPNSLEHSFREKVQLHVPCSVQFTNRRFVSNIDLEDPITCFSQDRMPSAESAFDLNQLVPPDELDTEKEVSHAMDNRDETDIRIAAETIHTMRFEKNRHPQGAAKVAHLPPSDDTLNWFADVVILNLDDQGNLRTESQGSSDVEGMDYFEYMTLNLEEVREEVYCSIPLESLDPKDEETGIAHLLLNKPRRGPARRRRQKRDFQRDILPGIASLSRHEVTEDMQLIEVLMRATGEAWEACGSRKNSGRSRTSARPRGRGRGRGTPAVVTITEAETSLEHHPSEPGNDTEVRTDGSGILVWGRTTRRCWKQRCSSGKILGPAPDLKATNSFLLPG